ncbi:unnamed protein product, partial [Urochloa humidicola]
LAELLLPQASDHAPSSSSSAAALSPPHTTGFRAAAAINMPSRIR